MSSRRDPSKLAHPNRAPFPLVPAALLFAVGALLLMLGVFFLPHDWFLERRLPATQWTSFRDRFVSPDGRVIDDGNGGVSHSEGQGYGMLFAEAFDDRPSFDRIWKWTRDNLQVRKDALFAWRWEPNERGGGGITDLNNASDGELLIAWALHRASSRWQNPSLAHEADIILQDLAKTCLKDSPLGVVLLPAENGFVHDNGGRITLNPSYFVFPALDGLANSPEGAAMRSLRSSGLAICQTARFGTFHLTPDWIVVKTDRIELPSSQEFPPVFGYNAIRIPLQIAWANPASPLLADYAAFWRSFPAGQPLPDSINLATNSASTNPMLPGMAAIAQFIDALSTNKPFSPFDVDPITPDEPYYSAALKLLTILAADEAPVDQPPGPPATPSPLATPAQTPTPPQPATDEQ